VQLLILLAERGIDEQRRRLLGMAKHLVVWSDNENTRWVDICPGLIFDRSETFSRGENAIF
jgi:hypothetical protein